MGTPRRFMYYTGDPTCPTQTSSPDDCLFHDDLPEAVRFFYSLPSTEAVSLGRGDRVLQGGVMYVLTSNATINLSANATVSDSNLASRFMPITGTSTFHTIPSTSVAIVRHGDTIVQSGRVYIRTATDTSQLAANASFSATNLTDDFIELTGGGGGGAVDSVTGGDGLENVGDATTGAVTLNVEPGWGKFNLFFGVPGAIQADTVIIGSTTTTMSEFITNIVSYYFVDGIQLDVDGTTIRTGDGLWTTVTPGSDAEGNLTLTGLNDTNSFNLIG